LESNERREKIVVLVRAAGELSVEDLSEETGVSRETIRRDLTRLDEEGLIKKFHGGARAERFSLNCSGNRSYAEHMNDHPREKHKLCETAAGLLEAGDTLFINSGSTAVFFAQAIANLEKLIIVTNSNSVANIVSSNPHHEIFLLGGNYKRERNQNIGMLTLEQIGKFHARFAVLTVSAVSNSEVSDFDLSATEVARAMIAHSEKTIILADHSKFAKRGPFSVAPDKKPDMMSDENYNSLAAKFLCGS